MKARAARRIAGIIAAAMLLLAGPAAPAQEAATQADAVKRVRESEEVLRQIQSIPEDMIPAELFRGGRAVAIFPKVIKVGLLVGGRFGQGLISVHGEDGRWSPPILMQLSGVSIGFQAGASSTDVILVFKNRESLERVLKGQVTLGANASVAAGPVGRQVEAATDVQMEAEIYSYSRSRGVFAGISLEGATIQVDDEANDLFYGKEGLRPQEILQGKVTRIPPEAQKLLATLAGVAK